MKLIVFITIVMIFSHNVLAREVARLVPSKDSYSSSYWCVEKNALAAWSNKLGAPTKKTKNLLCWSKKDGAGWKWIVKIKENGKRTIDIQGRFCVSTLGRGSDCNQYYAGYILPKCSVRNLNWNYGPILYENNRFAKKSIVISWPCYREALRRRRDDEAQRYYSEKRRREAESARKDRKRRADEAYSRWLRNPVGRRPDQISDPILIQ